MHFITTENHVDFYKLFNLLSGPIGSAVYRSMQNRKWNTSFACADSSWLMNLAGKIVEKLADFSNPMGDEHQNMEKDIGKRAAALEFLLFFFLRTVLRWNSWKYNFVEISGNNLEISQKWCFYLRFGLSTKCYLWTNLSFLYWLINNCVVKISDGFLSIFLLLVHF